jgi:hypothetical protein
MILAVEDFDDYQCDGQDDDDRHDREDEEDEEDEEDMEEYVWPGRQVWDQTDPDLRKMYVLLVMYNELLPLPVLVIKSVSNVQMRIAKHQDKFWHVLKCKSLQLPIKVPKWFCYARSGQNRLKHISSLFNGIQNRCKSMQVNIYHGVKPRTMSFLLHDRFLPARSWILMW